MHAGGGNGSGDLLECTGAELILADLPSDTADAVRVREGYTQDKQSATCPFAQPYLGAA